MAPQTYTFMTEIQIGYARYSTDRQDLAAQQEAFISPGVSPDRIYTDRGLTGSNRQGKSETKGETAEAFR